LGTNPNSAIPLQPLHRIFYGIDVAASPLCNLTGGYGNGLPFISYLAHGFQYLYVRPVGREATHFYEPSHNICLTNDNSA
jgi:hypothetical protein